MFKQSILAASAALAFAAPMAAPAAPASSETIVLAGGCFWGMEGTFEHVKGVTSVVSGYAGGSAGDATYDSVSTERTGHAEAIRLTFDPSKISLGQIMQVYFVVAHDSTQVNGQYPDTGPSYRSAVFPQSPAQKAFVAAYIKDLNSRAPLKGRVATRIESGAFYPAETYHQDFMRKNPTHPYIQRWDVPRIKKLKATYPALYRDW
ncbi:MAG: peptide-methionine (S)-S-oxide reductase MsrA [Pseudomonadota bacterium]|nr:peptide-methionine (S)-S-oxide reductase MsrA [Pseudomonadota bacterium]